MGLIDKLKRARSRRTQSWVTMEDDVLVRHERRNAFSRVKTTGTFDIKSARKITTFKIDLVTTDAICLRFEGSDGTGMTLCEEDPAWLPVMDTLAKWDGIDREWYQNVMLPVFETCETVIYERDA